MAWTPSENLAPFLLGVCLWYGIRFSETSNCSCTSKVMSEKKKDFMGVYKKRYNPSKEGYGNATDWNRAFNARMGMYEAKKTLGDADPLSVLELTGNPTWDEIKAQYRKLALKYHPDRNPGDDEAVTMFKRVQAAYEILEEKYSG